MKKLFFAILLCGITCLVSCSKLEDDQLDGENSGGVRPLPPGYKEYSIDEGINCRDSIQYDNLELKQDIN